MTTTPSAEALAARVKQLANEYAHCYSFVGDDTMPIKKRELEEAIDRLAALSAEPKAQAKLASSGQAASAVPELRMGGRMQVKPDYSDLSREALEAHAARMAQALQELWPKTPLAAPASPTQPASAPAREGVEAHEAELQEAEIGALCYRGNTVSFMYDKARAYGDALTETWDVLKEFGHHCDGATRLKDKVREVLSTPPAPRAPSIEPVGHVIEVEEHVSGTWGQKRRVRCVVWTGEPPAVGEALFLRVALPTAPASAGVEEFPLPEAHETAEPIGFITEEALRLLRDPEWLAQRGTYANLWGTDGPPNRAIVPVFAAPVSQPEALPLKSMNWHPGPIKTEWGDGMLVADVELSPDQTLTMFIHKNALPLLKDKP